MPALSSDSDKDGEDEGNDEDELSGLQSFHIQSNCNTERDSGINGSRARADIEKNDMMCRGEETRYLGLSYSKVCAERDRNRSR